MLDGLFNARRVAVIGVSPQPMNLGNVIMSNQRQMGFSGEVFAVGRQGGETELGPIYKSVDELPTEIDLGVIMVPARFVPESVEACGRKGARWVVISSAGFGELGPERAGLEQAALAAARRFGIRVVGPNCLGVANWATGLTTSFAPVPLWLFHHGPVSIVSQSGGLSDCLSGMISDLSLGMNKFISIGNKLDVDEVDCLSYLADDPSTEVICVYLEDIRRGRALIETAQRCHKPILMLKGNASVAGARIAKSHTAALAADDQIVDAAFRQAGIVRMYGLRNMALASAVMRLPKMRGNRVAAMCLSGGVSVVLADLCESLGFVLPVLDQDLLDDLQSRGRSGVIRLTNPLDMGDIFGGEHFAETIRRVASLDYIDGMVVVSPIAEASGGATSRGSAGEIIPMVKDLSRRLQKPIVLANMPSTRSVADAMRQYDYPLFSDPEDAARALAALYRYSMLSR